MSKPARFVGLGCLLFIWLAAFDDLGQVQAARATAQAGEGSKLTFELYQDAGKDFRWRLKSANGNILATAGQAYKAKADCKESVDRIMKNLDKQEFEVYQDKAKEFRWRLKSSNGQVIAASSEGYSSKTSCDSAIDSIKKGVAKATVVDAK